MCHSSALVLHITPKKEIQRIMSVMVEAVDLARPAKSNVQEIFDLETPGQLTSTAVGHCLFARTLKTAVLPLTVQQKIEHFQRDISVQFILRIR
jgi:hypothetical protein